MIELYILLIILVFALAVHYQKFIPDSSCTGDCDQGRNCNCVTQDKDNQNDKR